MNKENNTNKDILLLGKKIVINKSEIVFNFNAETMDYKEHFDVKAGNWIQENGYLIGTELGNQGGIIYTNKCFDYDILVTINMGTVLPATRDVNAVWHSHWDQNIDYLGDSYVCGVNGWYENKSGIERSGSHGFYTSTSLYKYKRGEDIKLQFGSIGSFVFMLVNNELITEMDDPYPLKDGYVGISPYCTKLKVKSVEVRKLTKESIEERKQFYNPEF